MNDLRYLSARRALCLLTLVGLSSASPSILAAQCPSSDSSEPQRCDGPVRRALSDARSQFSQSCPGLVIRDCDPADGGWQCSSGVIGSNAPGGVAATDACEETVTETTDPIAEDPVPEPVTPAQEPAPTEEPASDELPSEEPIAQEPPSQEPPSQEPPSQEPVVAEPAAMEPPPAAGPLTVVESNDATDGNSSEVELQIGLSEARRYGFRWANVIERRVSAEFSFEGGSETLTLTATGFDIDGKNEVQVLVNGRSIGQLESTSNNGTSVTTLPVNVNDQRNGTNILEFRQRVPGWIWGVADIMLTLGCNYPLVEN